MIDFDVDARIRAPGNGIIPAIVGTKRSVAFDIHGTGSWSRWRGTAMLDLANRPALRLNLGVDKGRYRLAGKWAPAQFLKGRLHRLTRPIVDIRGDAHARRPPPRWSIVRQAPRESGWRRAA